MGEPRRSEKDIVQDVKDAVRDLNDAIAVAAAHGVEVELDVQKHHRVGEGGERRVEKPPHRENLGRVKGSGQS